jgi:hypothetical protein
MERGAMLAVKGFVECNVVVAYQMSTLDTLDN